MGGLISLYAFFRYPDIFGAAGAMSPAFWFANKAIYKYVRAVPYAPGKLYLDAGTREFGGRSAGRVEGGCRQTVMVGGRGVRR